MKSSRLCSRTGAALLAVLIAGAAFPACQMTKQFTEGLRVIAGKGGTKEERDTFKEVLPVARDLASFEQKPEWQTVFRADATDLMEFVSPDRVLIGTVQVSAYLAEPSYGAVQMYDATTGRMLWEGKRPDVPKGVYSLLSSAPVILLCGASAEEACLSALDPETGATLWEREFKRPCLSLLDGERGIFVIGQLAKTGVQISGIGVRDGLVIWSQVLPSTASKGPDSQGPLPAARDDGRFYLAAASGLFGVSTESGGIVWRTINPAGAASAGLQISEGGLILTGKGRMWMVDKLTGKKAWGPLNLAGDPVAVCLPPGSASAFVVSRQTSDNPLLDPKDTVQSVSLASGKVGWARPVKVPVQSPLLPVASQVAFTTFDSLECLDAKTGRILSSIPFPEGWAGGGSDLPDVVVERAGLVIAANEKKGVFAFSPSEGKLRWFQTVDRSLGSKFWFATRSGELAQASGTADFLGGKAKQDSQWWANQVRAVDYQWSGYDYSGSYGAQSKDSFGQSMVLFQSMLALSSGLENALQRKAQANLVQRKLMELGSSAGLQARCFQGKYWVRPFDKRGLGAVIVDLDSGQRSDLQFSAVNPGMSIYGVVLPCLRVSPDGKRLVTAGIGVDESRYERYVKFKWGMPYPSILSFDLASLRFSPNEWDDCDLSFAASEGNIARVKALLEGGAWVDSRTILGNTALEEAAGHGQDDTVRLLLSSGASVNHRDEGAWAGTPMELAAFNGHASTVKILLEAGADPGAAAKLAAEAGHNDVVKLLNQSAPASIESLEDALAVGSAEDVARFIRTRAEADRSLDKGRLVIAEGTTPLILAASAGNLEAVRYLLGLGANVNRMERTVNKDSALMKASDKGHAEIVRLLLQARASVNAKGDDNWTALYKAAWASHLEVARLLLDAGADANARTKHSGDSALLVASCLGNVDMVKLLLERGANINGRDKDKTTPLMKAADNAQAAVVEVLLEAGADVTAKDAAGRTALDIARAASVVLNEKQELVVDLLEGAQDR
jgi:ankyrin repeat protein/outer membrane protein assembly factor BamB